MRIDNLLMPVIDEKPSLSSAQKILLVLFGLALVGFLFFLRGGMTHENTLSNLARRSLEPEVGLANGKPTVFEFYADWCEACREMSPSMLSLESKYTNDVDFVFLNIDNILWQDLIVLYDVNGIPQLNFFDANGTLKGSSLGVRSEEELNKSIEALLGNQELPEFNHLSLNSQISKLNKIQNSNYTSENFSRPRSHS